MFAIVRDDLSGGRTRALPARHLEGMRAASPPGSVFALDFAGLATPDVTVWSAWAGGPADGPAGGRIAAVGALRRLGDGTGEVKSMRAPPISGAPARARRSWRRSSPRRGPEASRG